MQHGIYYAYWEREWKGDYKYYIEKADIVINNNAGDDLQNQLARL